MFVRAEEDEVRENVVVSCVSRQELQCLDCSQWLLHVSAPFLKSNCCA